LWFRIRNHNTAHKLIFTYQLSVSWRLGLKSQKYRTLLPTWLDRYVPGIVQTLFLKG
jgi:hypothetical protein